MYGSFHAAPIYDRWSHHLGFCTRSWHVIPWALLARRYKTTFPSKRYYASLLFILFYGSIYIALHRHLIQSSHLRFSFSNSLWKHLKPPSPCMADKRCSQSSLSKSNNSVTTATLSPRSGFPFCWSWSYCFWRCHWQLCQQIGNRQYLPSYFFY